MYEFFAPDPLIPGTYFSIDYQKSGYGREYLHLLFVWGTR
jgi:hypothetical protein